MAEHQITFKEERKDFQAHLAHINQNRNPVSLLLDRVHDIRNVGAIFRLADSARIRKVYIYKSPDWKLTSQKAIRIARQTIQYVPYEILEELEEVKNLKENHQLIALEWTNKSIPYTEFAPKEETILILGNEQFGISDDLLALAETSIHIPMLGVNTSMNVACAAGIVVYDLLKTLRS
jgi:tRNA G18 (ribose-2'-O)-methylase SpoU